MPVDKSKFFSGIQAIVYQSKIQVHPNERSLNLFQKHAKKGYQKFHYALKKIFETIERYQKNFFTVHSRLFFNFILKKIFKTVELHQKNFFEIAFKINFEFYT